MSDDNSSSVSPWSAANVLFPGIIVAALALFGYLRSEPALRSSRPDSKQSQGFPLPPSPNGVHAFYSRLWEDPLETSYREGNPAQSESSPLTHLAAQLGIHGIEPATSDFKPAFASVLKAEENKLLCLAVMLPGEPFLEDREDRMRIRHAIHSALAVCGYSLAYPTRMTYVDVPVTTRMDDFNSTVNLTLRVPLKLFRKSDPGRLATSSTAPQDVLVLWVNSSQTGTRPMNAVAQILAQFFEPDGKTDDCESSAAWKKKINVHLLGPEDSDGLKTIAKELCQGFDEPEDSHDHITHKRLKLQLQEFGSFQVYSPRATVPDSELPKIQQPVKPPPGAKPPGNGACDAIIRTIGDDHCLAEALIAELRLRGAWPATKPSSKKKLPAKTVVLVTERDTLYGRTFPKTFEDCADHEVQTRCFAFLRGIDGERGSGRRNGRNPDPDAVPQKASREEEPQRDDPHPDGPSQLDYLERLEQQLLQIHAGEQIAGREGIAAIGIVGTDVYDKILILRALHTRFPKAVFFTTDLDAELFYADELRNTRNVIVASHFGLLLGPSLQQDVPPFRNSYQTSMYFASLLALEAPILQRIPEVARKDLWAHRRKGDGMSFLKPVVFEIGSNGPYQLTIPKDDDQQMQANTLVHPASPRQELWLTFPRSVLLTAGCAFLTLCLFVYVTPIRRLLGWTSDTLARDALVRFARRVGLATVLIVIPVGIVLWDHRRQDGEPFLLNEGISLWPTTIVRYVTLLVTSFLFCKALSNLNESSDRLDKKYWRRSIVRAGRGPKRLWKLLRQAEFLGVWRRLWFRVLVFNWPDVRHAGRRIVTPGARVIKASSLYDEYARRGDWRYRLLRVIPLTLAYFAFGICLFKLFDNSANPFRGWVSRTASSGVLYLSVLPLIALVFLVLDATQLTRRFIGALKTAEPDWASDEMNRLIEQRLPDDGANDPQRDQEKRDIREMFTIQLIAERSNVVGKLIIYPFITILLMFVARNPAFDYLTLGWPLLLLWTIMLTSAVVSSLYVRRSAGETRDAILLRLGNSLSASVGTPRFERLKQLIDGIQKESGGAFGPLMNDPVFRALAIPFGGATGLLLIQQYLPSLLL